jgi:hypothetical protein
MGLSQDGQYRDSRRRQTRVTEDVRRTATLGSMFCSEAALSAGTPPAVTSFRVTPPSPHSGRGCAGGPIGAAAAGRLCAARLHQKANLPPHWKFDVRPPCAFNAQGGGGRVQAPPECQSPEAKKQKGNYIGALEIVCGEEYSTSPSIAPFPPPGFPTTRHFPPPSFLAVPSI